MNRRFRLAAGGLIQNSVTNGEAGVSFAGVFFLSSRFKGLVSVKGEHDFWNMLAFVKEDRRWIHDGGLMKPFGLRWRIANGERNDGLFNGDVKETDICSL
mmetsp:Transcript_16638/g.34776  ORF Transcript_16638/g.34776 Transcript_16638/m.34776 type:complete len:100 (-) Transcript_16638:211-510(-)